MTINRFANSYLRKERRTRRKKTRLYLYESMIVTRIKRRERKRQRKREREEEMYDCMRWGYSFRWRRRRKMQGNISIQQKHKTMLLLTTACQATRPTYYRWWTRKRKKKKKKTKTKKKRMRVDEWVVVRSRSVCNEGREWERKKTEREGRTEDVNASCKATMEGTMYMAKSQDKRLNETSK